MEGEQDKNLVDLVNDVNWLNETVKKFDFSSAYMLLDGLSQQPPRGVSEEAIHALTAIILAREQANARTEDEHALYQRLLIYHAGQAGERLQDYKPEGKYDPNRRPGIA